MTLFSLMDVVDVWKAPVVWMLIVSYMTDDPPEPDVDEDEARRLAEQLEELTAQCRALIRQTQLRLICSRVALESPKPPSLVAARQERLKELARYVAPEDRARLRNTIDLVAMALEAADHARQAAWTATQRWKSAKANAVRWRIEPGVNAKLYIMDIHIFR
jgi:DNA repair exonuclease SbcCD ATPase subunit